MSDNATDWIDLPPEELMGEAMKRLNPRQQKFVVALGVFCDQKKAYAYAGYHSKDDRVASSAASRLAANPDVIEAVHEETKRRIGINPLLGISTIARLAASAKNEAVSLSAAKELLGLGGYIVKTEHKVVVEDTRSAAQIAEGILDMLKQPELKKLAVVSNEPAVAAKDADFEEIDPEIADLI